MVGTSRWPRGFVRSGFFGHGDALLGPQGGAGGEPCAPTELRQEPGDLPAGLSWSPSMEPLVRHAPRLGALTVLLAASSLAAAWRSGEPIYAEVSGIFAAAGLLMGILARGRRATLLLVVPCLTYLVLLIDITNP